MTEELTVAEIGNNTPKNIVAEIKARWMQDPEAPLEQVLHVDKNVLRESTPDEFEDYIRFCNQLDADNVIADNLDVVADRFGADIQQFSTKPYPERFRAMDIGDTMRMAIWRVASNPELRVQPETLDKLYNYINSTDRILAHHAFEYVTNLIYIDNRNKTDSTQLNLLQRYRDDAVDALIYPEAEGNAEKAQRLIDAAWADFPGELRDFMITAFDKADNMEARKFVWAVCANRIGLGEARKQLRTHADLHPQFAEKLKLAEEAIGLDKVEQVYSDLRDLYEQINFKEYKPNEALNAEETELLYSELKDKQRVLDIGAGTGRLMQSLKEKGVNVFGFDYVRTHAQLIKDTDPESNIAVASWHNMPYKEGTFDAAYCMGRSILHNTTVEDMITFFRESSRVLTKDGTLIVDIPNPDIGLYAEARNKIAARAQELGIQHFEDGMIHDSPDGKNFFDRMAPSKEQFIAIAAIAGFDAQIISDQNYVDTEGHENQNWYWKLTKKQTKPSVDELMDHMHNAYTSSPPVTLTWL